MCGFWIACAWFQTFTGWLPATTFIVEPNKTSMKHLLAILSITSCSAVNALGANLLGYYALDGNYESSGGAAGPAVPAMNPGELSFGTGFRGQGLNVNDPDANPNSGGSVNIPIDSNAATYPDVSFGGWVNINNNEFDGFLSTDNGGWDRGITVNAQDSGQFGIASGAAPANIGDITPGSWQYVLGTFSRSNNRSTLYVGSAILGSQTTLSVSTVDANVAGESFIEIGRYDNQDLNGIVDDVFVFGSELDAHEANAIRNLRLSLDLSPAEAATLFDMFDSGTGGEVGGYQWAPTSGLDTTNPGSVQDLGGSYGLVLDDAGNGLSAVPEPTVSILAGLGACLLFLRRRRS